MLRAELKKNMIMTGVYYTHSQRQCKSKCKHMCKYIDEKLFWPNAGLRHEQRRISAGYSTSKPNCATICPTSAAAPSPGRSVRPDSLPLLVPVFVQGLLYGGDLSGQKKHLLLQLPDLVDLALFRRFLFEADVVHRSHDDADDQIQENV